MRRLVLLLLVGLMAFSACSSADEVSLPAVELDRLGGGTIDLAATGQPRILNLWATWCAPCRAELPAFDRVAAETDRVEIIGISTGDSGEDAAELVDELGLSFPQALDPKAAVQIGLRITGMPATIFVGATGEVLEIRSGELEQGELTALISEHFSD